MPRPLPLSVAIVCKNNADTIGRTLASVQGLVQDGGEIVAIDSGSTDGTIELIERALGEGGAGGRVIRSEWLGHIRTKQKALEATRHWQTGQGWVLSIDSDESVEPGLAAAIGAAIERDDPTNDRGVLGYEVNRRTYYKGTPLRHVWQPEWRLRLVRAGHARWGGLDPHDKLELVGDGKGGRIERLVAGDDAVLRHDSFPTFAAHFATQVKHATTMAHSLHAAGEKGSLLSLLVSPPGAFVKQLVLKQGFRDGLPGWLAASSAAVAAMVKHAVLLERSYKGDAM